MNEKKNLLNISAQVISVLFHPFFMPVYGLLIFFNAPTFLSYIPYEVKRAIFIIAVITTIIIPMTMLPFFLYRRIIKSYRMETHTERIGPLLLVSVVYTLTFYLLNRLQIPDLIKTYFLGASVTVLLTLLVNFWWKISIHSVGMGGLLAAVLVLSFRMQTDLTVFILPLLLAAGLTGFARLQLQAHKPSQVYSGYLLGMAGMVLVLYLV